MASQASSLPATVPENEELAENPESNKISAPAREESTMRLRLRSFARRTKEKAAKESSTAAAGSDNSYSSANEGDDNSAPVVTMAGDLVDHDAPQEEDEVVVEEHAQHTVVDDATQENPADNVEADASSDDGGTGAQEGGSTHEMRQPSNAAATPEHTKGYEAETSERVSAASEAPVHHDSSSAGDTQAQHEAKGVTTTNQTKKSVKSRLGGNIQVTLTEEERARYAKLGMLGTAPADEKPKTERSRIYQALNPDRLYQEQEASGVSRVSGCRLASRLRIFYFFLCLGGPDGCHCAFCFLLNQSVQSVSFSFFHLSL
jgi:hypothetical protein